MKNQEKISWDEHLDFLHGLKSDSAKQYWLVIERAEGIGIVNLQKLNNVSAEGGLYKNPELKRPVGRLLIKMLELEARAMGYQEIILNVKDNNDRAIGLYRGAGYSRISHDADYIVMKKNIGSKVTIVAELSANHGHNIETAMETISAAAESGADAIKIQTYTTDTITIDSDKEYFRIKSGTLWDGQTLYGLYRQAYTPWEWHAELKEYAESLGLIFFSTPFDKSAVDFLEKLDVPWYKIASFEITDTPLIEYAASKGKPMILSTGIADASDILLAVESCRKVDNDDITLLQCVSSYPASPETANLRMIPNLAETFGVKSGLSDHTEGSVSAIAAAALGAVMIEKHFILDKKIGGPDASFSMEPRDFKYMVESVRITEAAMGKIDYSLTEKKKQGRKFSRSLFAVEDIEKGAVLTEQNVRSIRPGDGLHPKYLGEVLGKTAACDIGRGEPLRWVKII